VVVSNTRQHHERASDAHGEMPRPSLQRSPPRPQSNRHAGQPATFSVVASGTAPLTYQCRKTAWPLLRDGGSYTQLPTTADSGDFPRGRQQLRRKSQQLATLPSIPAQLPPSTVMTYHYDNGGRSEPQ